MFLALYFLAVAGLELGGKTGKILWPTSTWVLSPVMSTSWHAAETVTLTLTFASTVEMTSGLVEVLFPDTFEVTKLTYDISEGVKALSDYSVSFYEFVLPDQGIYGPVEVRLRVSDTGSIVAINQFFANLYVDGPKPVPVSGSLSATFYDITTVYVQDETSIYFDFNIEQDLWKYDVFYLYLDQHFTIENPVCKSLKVIGEYNNLNSTIPSSLNTLACEYEDDSKRVVIYGLGVDIYVDKLSSTGSITGRLLVTGFTNPNAQYNQSDFSWELYIGRYAVNTFIAAYEGSGPSIKTGSISVSSWVPSKSGFSEDNIPLGLTLYMDLKFTTMHDIPTAGKIKFKFSGGVDILNKSWRYLTTGEQLEINGDEGYYFISPYVGGTCEISTATDMVCGDFDDTVSAGTLTLTTYSYFLSTSPSVVSITTYVDDEITVIDEVVANPAKLTYVSATELDVADYFNVYFADTTEVSSLDDYRATTGTEVQYLFVKVKLPEDCTDTEFTVTLPMSTNNNLNDIYLPTETIIAKYGLDTDETTVSFASADLTTLSVAEISGDTLTFTATFLSTQYLTVVIELDSEKFNLPYVGSNLLTQYEVFLSVKPVNITYFYAKSLSFIPASPDLSFEILCTDTLIAGLPATVSFTPPFAFELSSSFDSDIKSTYDFYIDITISGGISDDFDSGLDIGNSFPFSSSISGSLTLSGSGILKYSGFPSISDSTEISIVFPFGKMINLYKYSAKVVVYYLDPSRTDVKYELIKTESDEVTAASNTADWTTQNIVGTSTFETSKNTGSLVFTLNDAESSGTIGFIFPQGYTISDGSVAQASEMGSFYFSSSDIYYKTPGIFAALDGSNTISGDTAFTVEGITTSTFFNPSSSSNSVIIVHTTGSNTACTSSTGTYPSITLIAGVISTPTFSPTKAVGASVDNLKLDLTVTFKNTHKIQKDGKIVFELSSSWQVTVTSVLSIKIGGSAISDPDYTLGTTTTISSLPEVSALSIIAITITNCVPPTNTQETSTKVGHLNKISTYATSADTEKIDEWADSTFDSLTLSPSLSTLNSTVSLVEIWPNSTSTSAFFYIEFSFPNDLPEGSTLSITSPVNSWLVTGDISSVCDCSLNYTSCEVSGNAIEIVIDENYVKDNTITLMIDHALEIDKSGTAEYGVKVSSSYYGITTDEYQDDGVFLEIGSELGDLLVTLSISPLSTCEFGDYTLNFLTSLEAGTVIQIFFPLEFDYFLGASSQTYIVTDPDVFFIPCSASFGTVECGVQHRAVQITLGEKITDSSITLYGIINPIFKDSYSAIKVYAISPSGVVLGYEYLTVSGITDFEGANIRIRRLSKSNNYLQNTADYTFKFYLDGFYDSGLSFIITFPRMFFVDRDTDSELECSLSYVNTTESLTLETEIGTTGQCINIKKNQFLLNMTQNFTFSSEILAILVIKDMVNPEWGRSMEDELDSDVYTVFDQWAPQLTITLLFDSQYKGKSYTNLNSAFTGFLENSYTFEANGYDPLTYEGTITLIPGTETKDLYITTSSAFKSKLAQVNPSNINNPVTLEFSSKKNFLIYNGEDYVQFRVSASIDSSISLNYISWIVTEATLDDGPPIYTEPVKTRVELYKGQVPVSIGSIPSIPKGSKSQPISVSVTYSPHTELIIGLISTEANITVYPTTLEFSRGINKLYFQIEVSENFTEPAGYKIVIQYELSGTDSSAYTISSSSFKIAEAGEVIPVINSVSFSGVGKKTMKVSVSTDVPTVLYWQLSEAGTVSMSLSEIQSSTASLVDDNSQLSFDEQASAYQDIVDEGMLTDETWTEYQRRLYKLFVQSSFTGCIYSGSTTTVLFNVDWLWAETNYKVVIYAGYEESNTTQYQKTNVFGNAAEITITIKQNVDTSYISTITSGLSTSLGLSSDQFELIDSSISSSKSVFNYILYPDRNSDITPYTLAETGPYTYLESVLEAIGIIGDLSVASTEIKRSATVGDIIEGPKLYAKAYNSITLIVNGSAEGEFCCGIKQESDIGEATKTLIGLSSTNEELNGECVEVLVNDTMKMVFKGFEAGTKYTFECIEFDDYPTWPSSNEVYLSSNYSTSSESSESNTVSAGELIGAIFIYLLG